MRAVIALTLLGSLAAPAFADAAPAKACQLVKDAKGDTDHPVADAALDSQLDVLSADVATDARNLTAVIRLAALTPDDPTNPQGRIYEFDFTANEKNFIVMGSLLPGGNDFNVFISDQRFEEGKSGARAATGIGTARGIVDPKTKEVRMTASLSVFGPYGGLPRNTVIQHLVAFTYKANGLASHGMTPEAFPVSLTGSFGVGADQAWGRSTYYRAAAPSCVRVGR